MWSVEPRREHSSRWVAFSEPVDAEYLSSGPLPRLERCSCTLPNIKYHLTLYKPLTFSTLLASPAKEHVDLVFDLGAADRPARLD